MDREFDRELDDDGWAPVNGSWRSFRAQLNNTLKAAGMMCNRKEKNKKLTEMREVAEQLIKRKGKNLDDKGALGRWLWEKEKECEVLLDQLAQQEKKAGVIRKRTLKKKAEAQEK